MPPHASDPLQPSPPTADAASARPAIVAEKLAKRFGSVVAVEDVSFAVAPREVVGLLGGNGAGKTTTISMLLGLLEPSGGRATILGAEMMRERYRVLHRVNFSSPYVQMPGRLSVRENLTVYARLYGVRRHRRHILDVTRSLEIDHLLDRKTGTLSARQRSRVYLAKSLLNQPDVLLLDEPTASLDPDSADFVRRYLRDYQHRTGAAILLASHNMLEVERLCDRVLMMRGGRIVDEGAPGELVARHGRETLEEVFLAIARAKDPEKAPPA